MGSSPLLQVAVGLVLYELFVVGVFSVRFHWCHRCCFVGCFVEAVEVLCVVVVPLVLFTGSGRWWWFDLIDGS